MATEFRMVDRDGISRARYGPRRPPLADLHDEDLCYPGRAPHGVEEREVTPWRRSHPDHAAVAALRNEQGQEDR